ncbi:DeoR/GlpR family DNA-binding transcription regulator [uncultured Cohaesibacter sp.]|uniref:DeoR/GlpR family DNA-binding transcription regulator n=1 Tax=uncultured Cohaesibacter sp. TaxID=1002546 RepID=UPI0029C75691|nr:DeoR/GlpR family DNA-binding transcription regulator [uncultured Cohaesibacter sp.]
MHPRERRREVLAYVNRFHDVTVEDLAEKLDVSRETIRRDLTRLESEGTLRKYHGGARSLEAPHDDPHTESPYATREAHNISEKRRIAAAAARLFKPGDSIFMDTGSTTLAVANALSGVPALTVITNSPRIAATIAEERQNKVFLIGGAYQPEVGENLGPLALEQITQFRADHAILTIGAMDQASIMDFDLQEAEIARAMIERADSVTIVADHSKLDRRAVFEVARLNRIARVITDRSPSPQLTAALAAATVELIVVNDDFS